MKETSKKYIVLFLFLVLSLFQHRTTSAFSPSLFTKTSFSNRVTEKQKQMTGTNLKLVGFQDAFASPDALDDYVAEKTRQQKALKRCIQVRTERSLELVFQDKEVDYLLAKTKRANYMIYIVKKLVRKLITTFKMLTEPSCDMIHPVYSHNRYDE